MVLRFGGNFDGDDNFMYTGFKLFLHIKDAPYRATADCITLLVGILPKMMKAVEDSQVCSTALTRNHKYALSC